MLDPVLAPGATTRPSTTRPTSAGSPQTARLTGPARYLAYGKLDLDLARNAAPLIAYGNSSSQDFFSARIGCQTYGVYGVDLAALCIKPRSH